MNPQSNQRRLRCASCTSHPKRTISPSFENNDLPCRVKLWVDPRELFGDLPASLYRGDAQGGACLSRPAYQCSNPAPARSRTQRPCFRKQAWPFYRTISGVRLCWELEEPTGPEGSMLESCFSTEPNARPRQCTIRSRRCLYRTIEVWGIGGDDVG